MKTNMGSTDRAIRAIVAIVIAVLYLTGVLDGVAGIGLLVLAGIFLVTSFVSYCPVYSVIGMSTCKQ